jgi:hypothetical protein
MNGRFRASSSLAAFVVDWDHSLSSPGKPCQARLCEPRSVEPLRRLFPISFISASQGMAHCEQSLRPHPCKTIEGNMVMMKTIASGLLVLGLLGVQVSEANAAACAAGPHRAGCVGPHGAVGVHRGYGYGYRGAAVVRPAYGAHCFWRAGVRVCR